MFYSLIKLLDFILYLLIIENIYKLYIQIRFNIYIYISIFFNAILFKYFQYI